jgi:hypothetical protein
MNRIVNALLLPLALLVLGGCASMNESECLNADWHMIGMEDGASGKTVSHIGNHRKACAKFNIKPDLAAYEDGHSAGMRQFCTETNGFQIGKSGGRYSGVCPAELEETFLSGYHAGQKLHAASSELSQAKSSVSSNKRKLQNRKDTLQAKEQLLINASTSEVQRIRLLDEIRNLEKEIEALELEGMELEEEQAVKESAYQEIQRSVR